MKITDGKHAFEVVTKIPSGHVIWNIGDNMIDGYLPICTVYDEYCVNVDSLKAIKIDDAKVLANLRNGAHYGVVDVKSARRKLNNKSPKSYVARQGKNYAELNLPILESLSE